MTALLLAEDGELRHMLGEMFGEARLDALLWHPPIALMHAWFGLYAAPFLAAVTASESIALDVQSRALRFQAARTGRWDLASGRLLGQALLLSTAVLASAAAPWSVGLLAMVGNDPLRLGASLLLLSARVVAGALPFVGLGVAASQLTRSPAWARLLALAGTGGTFALHALLQAWRDEPLGRVWSALDLLLPQAWTGNLWEDGPRWLLGLLGCAALALAWAGLGYLRFGRRAL